jgi:glycerophosphoryl diester phosphodiesterase
MHPLLDLSAQPVIGHRGNAAHAPENTLESFRQAVEIGVDALEMDVRLTADGHVVVIHDSTLDRTTDQSGRVESLTLAEIQRADAGARFTKDNGATWPYRKRGITVPTLDEVLTIFPSTPLLIEIKTADASRATRELIERHRASDRCIVAAFDERAMDAFRGSGIAQGASRRDTAGLLWRALLGSPPPRVGFNVLCMPPEYHGLPLPVGGYARILAPLGVPVHVWTVDEPAAAKRLRERGVRGIISNDPGAIRAS